MKQTPTNCGKFEDEPGARGHCKNCGGTYHEHYSGKVAVTQEQYKCPVCGLQEKPCAEMAAELNNALFPTPTALLEVARKYALGGFVLPVRLEFPTLANSKVNVRDAKGRLIKRFNSTMAARSMVAKLNNP